MEKKPATCARQRAVLRSALSIILVILATLPADARTFATLFNFDNTHGANPYASPVQGRDGNLYGTTYYGGANGLGVVYRVSPNGTFTLVHSFDYIDGTNPTASLLLGNNGNFYGTTLLGGLVWGTVFKVT